MKELGFVLLPGPGSGFFAGVGEMRKSQLWTIIRTGCGEKGKAKKCYFNLAVQILGNPAEDQAPGSFRGRAGASAGTEGAVDGVEGELLREDTLLLTSAGK